MGYPHSFSKKLWHILGSKVINLCPKIFDTKIIPRDINKTYMCLIPKFNNANNLKNLRPISLCNTIYKVVTKVMSKRIKLYLNHLINIQQACFLKDRWASDNAIIIREVLKKFNSTKGKEKLILKLDLEKAFDKLEWPYIYRTLKKI